MNANSGSGSSGTFIWGLVAGIVAVAAVGGLYLSGFFGGTPEPTAPEVAETAEAPAPTTEATAEPEAAPVEETPTEAAEAEPENEETEAPAAQAPVLDQIFVEADGNALLSGNAEPGSEVNVLLDGESVHRFTVDDSGQFAEFLTIPFADAARGLALETQREGETTRSDDYLIAALPKPPEPEATALSEDGPDQDVVATDAAPEPEEPAVETAALEETSEPELPASETAEGEAAPEPDATASETADAPDVASAEPRETEQTTPTSDPQPDVKTPQAEQDQQVAILRSGEQGVELVQPPTVRDVPPKQIALDTIGYSDTGDVQLTGRAQDGSAVRLYLNNRLVADLPPAADGQWRGEVEGIDPGVYTLRVDEVAPDGTVVSRLETPFKREPVEVLRAAEDTGQGDIPTETPPIRSVTVQQGDTLWAISRERFGDGVLYVRLFEANRESIRDPDLIFPGQIFTIPE